MNSVANILIKYKKEAQCGKFPFYEREICRTVQKN